ncbi:MAG: GNAT family N-acetyltransferase [Thermomicrobiales bacterium]
MTAAMTRQERCWEQMLRADEANLAYFAERAELPGVSLFFAEHEEATEFDVALIYRTPAADSDATLLAIGDAFHARGRIARIRLSPLSAPADWTRRLARGGFVADERAIYFSVPRSLQVRANPLVDIARVTSRADADQFSAIQVIGFAIPLAQQEWDRLLARRHLADQRHLFYLASLAGRVVGAARCIHLPNHMATMACLATHPDARGHGVGTSLLARMIADARARKNRVVCGAVVPGSDAARLYARLGFAFHFATTTFREPPGARMAPIPGANRALHVPPARS